MAMERMGVMPEGLPSGASAAGTRGGDVLPAVRVQMLATEHWSLLATRSLSWNEAFSRASMFLSALSGGVVALALAAQAMAFGQGFVLFALLLLPVMLFLGIATYMRLVAINNEDVRWVIGMNLLRHAYLESAPDLAPYFITGTHDDEVSIMQTFGARPGRGALAHEFVTTPGMLGVVVGVLAGVLAGVVAAVLGLGIVMVVGLGVVVFVATVALLLTYQYRAVVMRRAKYEPRFPAP